MTQETKHTPGPWVYHHDWNGIYSKEDDRGASVRIAEMARTPDYKANARLIAAAPELLDALERAHTLLVALYVSEADKSRREIIADHMDKNSKIIAKAKGQ